jgi:hypothetical protein
LQYCQPQLHLVLNLCIKCFINSDDFLLTNNIIQLIIANRHKLLYTKVKIASCCFKRFWIY